MASGRQPPAAIDKTAARRFPLVHQLIHFADLRNVYREMREALISANRRAGAQQGLVTKAKKKIAKLEAELSLLEQERNDLLAYRQTVEQEANQISALLPRLKGRLLQVQQIEQALENLADIKEAVDQQERANGGPSRQSSDDLRRAAPAGAAPRSATASAPTSRPSGASSPATPAASMPTSTARPNASKTATRPCWLKPPASSCRHPILRTLLASECDRRGCGPRRSVRSRASPPARPDRARRWRGSPW